METFRKCIVEFIGTFFLMLTIGLGVLISGESTIAPIAIGVILMVMVYAGGYISGGHYNPAVSLAATIRGALGVKDCILYMITQFLAAYLASLLVIGFAGGRATLIACPFSVWKLAVAEFLFTFALCYVVLTTATSNVSKNSYYGVAIGGTVLVGAFAVGGVLCYGAFNPAVVIGLMSMHVACVSTAMITLGVTLAAGLVAALVYKLVDAEHDCR